MGEGLSSESSNWIPPLWQEANSNFIEISTLAKKNANGNIVGIWGAMSDFSGKFERWKEGGKYLAGCEVADDAIPPDGWTKWTLPAFKFVVSKCTQKSYKDTLKKILSEYLPQKIIQLSEQFKSSMIQRTIAGNCSYAYLLKKSKYASRIHFGKRHFNLAAAKLDLSGC
nr:GyrI-like domain-containing protein [Cohnella sp. GbtcB17]